MKNASKMTQLKKIGDLLLIYKNSWSRYKQILSLKTT